MAPTCVDSEEMAKRELIAIHPNIRAHVTSTIDRNVWAKMSCVEKLEAVKQRMSPSDDDKLTNFEKDMARLMASANQEEAEEAEAAEEAKVNGPKFHPPAGRCPYGLDRGTWSVTETEMQQHNSAHSCWVCIESEVYDVTQWLQKHQGDASDASDRFRSWALSPSAKSQLKEFHVGKFVDPEEEAKKELIAIPPMIRMQITESIDMDVWATMSCVEKLEMVKQRLPEVNDTTTEFEKEASRRLADGEADVLDGPTPENSDDDEAEEISDTRPEYWAPKGRCPYGMDTGTWAITDIEMRQHNSAQSCWISIESEVFDVTRWLKKHPGGAATILNHAGYNASDAFRSVNHSPSAMMKLKKYHIGQIVDPEEAKKLADEVCPISGKEGVCPVSGKEAPAAAPKKKQPVSF